MLKSNKQSLHLAASPVYLASTAVNNLICGSPRGTAYFVGVALMTMMTGQLMHHQGSLARAALPSVRQIKWGWHRVERAMARGRFSLDALIESAFQWCLLHLQVEPVVIGQERRHIYAIDSSTIARRRSMKATTVLGKGYSHVAGRAVKANLVASLSCVVTINGIRCGLVRQTRCAHSSEQAVAALFSELPQTEENRLLTVDAGMATKEQFAAASRRDALSGRLRSNVTLRRAPRPVRKRPRGRPRIHGATLHPGRPRPEVSTDEDILIKVEKREVRLRRWRNLHFVGQHKTTIDVVRVDDPDFKRPLLIGTTALELTTEEIREAYLHRWPVETNFYVSQATTARERPRAWTETSVKRRLSLALMTGSLLKAISAQCEAWPRGPWDRRAVSSAGRLAHHLDAHSQKFAALSLSGIRARNYCKKEDANDSSSLQLSEAA
jgi:hypothetical protein